MDRKNQVRISRKGQKGEKEINPAHRESDWNDDKRQRIKHHHICTYKQVFVLFLYISIIILVLNM